MNDKFLKLIWIFVLLTACSEQNNPHTPSMPVEPQKVAVKEKPEVTKAPPKKVASSYILTKSEAQKRLSSGATLFDIPLPLRNSRNEAL